MNQEGDTPQIRRGQKKCEEILMSKRESLLDG